MLRKLLVATVAAAGLLTPLAVAPLAQAVDWHHQRRHDFGCEVLYRDPCNPCWVMAGRFRNHREAERIAESYRCRGFAVSIR
jgi:hypothetical protein